MKKMKKKEKKEAENMLQDPNKTSINTFQKDDPKHDCVLKLTDKRGENLLLM